MKCIIDFLNVGFGEATVIRLIDRERSFCAVVDGGDVDPLSNPRRCSLEQYVDEQIIEKIDALIITHFHKDHIGGILAIMDKLPIMQVMLHVQLPAHIMQGSLNDHSTPMLASLTLYKQILDQAAKLAIPIKLVTEPYTIHEQELFIKLLMPDSTKLQLLQDELNKLDIMQPAQLKKRLSLIDRMLNETAMAVLIRCNGASAVLLTSDVGLEFWKPYEAELGQVHVLQAPHHGDIRSISQHWLHKLSPQIVIISADDEGTYQLPHPQFEALIREYSEADVYYTEANTTTHRIIRIDVNEWRLELVE